MERDLRLKMNRKEEGIWEKLGECESHCLLQHDGGDRSTGLGWLDVKLTTD